MLKHLEDEHPLANWLKQRNLARQYDFMNSSFLLWQQQERPKVSLTFLTELNFYGVHHLTARPGVFRSKSQVDVDIVGTPHIPPKWDEVESLLAQFLSTLHEMFEPGAPLEAAAYALWRLNWVHPFEQGNGRTSRALCYFLICQGYDLWFPGSRLLPELIKATNDEYNGLLAQTDSSLAAGRLNLNPIQEYLARLMDEQIESIPVREEKS